jgi:SpoVK/Ycf46/Vps4 family AAA+-type ATPase
MNNNKLVDEIIKEMDNNYGNNNNPYYNINDLLFLNNNNNKIYKNSGISTNLNIRNPNISLLPITHNNDLTNNKKNIQPEPEPEPEIEIKEVNVEASIDNIEDLIKMIDKYPLEKHIKYNINMKAMHDIKPDLIELNRMIGMHNLKMNIVDQILYFIQDLHINESKKKKREEREIKEKQEKEKQEKEKHEPKKKLPTINLKGGGGLFSGLDLSSAFGGRAPKEPICIDNDNNDYLHTVIYGPPGTGKTEVAKIMGKIYSKLGILKKGLFKKATRSDFVAGYLGQTAMKTKDLIEECLGGVLFIDEAYALGNNEGKDSFAKEAIDTLCEGLSNHKNDIMVIIAGYEKELNDCFFSFNQGLESRFPWKFKTEDYKPEELKLIFKKQVLDSEWRIDDDELKDEWFNSKMKYFKHYGRDMETLFSKVKIAHGRRIFCNLECEKKKLTVQDLDKGFESYLENENKQDIEYERITKQIRDTLYV